MGSGPAMSAPPSQGLDPNPASKSLKRPIGISRGGSYAVTGPVAGAAIGLSAFSLIVRYASTVGVAVYRERPFSQASSVATPHTVQVSANDGIWEWAN